MTLFNEDAIKTDQVEETKFRKVTKWFSDKLGIHKNEDYKDEQHHTSENISKYIKKSIQQ